MSEQKFNHKEREHLDVLAQRLDYLRGGADDYQIGMPGFFAGEANALAWALSLLANDVTPTDVRLERIERRAHQQAALVGRLAKRLETVEEELELEPETSR